MERSLRKFYKKHRSPAEYYLLRPLQLIYQLIRGDQVTAHRAVPVDTPEAVDVVTRLMGRGSGARYWLGRVMLLWAPIKPVRLDPRPPGDA